MTKPLFPPYYNAPSCYHLFDTPYFSYYLSLNNNCSFVDRIGSNDDDEEMKRGWIELQNYKDYLNDYEYLDHKEDYDRAFIIAKKFITLL